MDSFHKSLIICLGPDLSMNINLPDVHSLPCVKNLLSLCETGFHLLIVADAGLVIKITLHGKIQTLVGSLEES